MINVAISFALPTILDALAKVMPQPPGASAGPSFGKVLAGETGEAADDEEGPTEAPDVKEMAIAVAALAFAPIAPRPAEPGSMEAPATSTLSMPTATQLPAPTPISTAAPTPMSMLTATRTGSVMG